MASSSRRFPPQLQLTETNRVEDGEPGFGNTGPDGCSFYRSLARQLQGNPDYFWVLRDAVLDHYIRVFIDQGRQDALHQTYDSFDRRFPSRLGPFFHALASPDATIARPPREIDGDVLLVICNTFNIRVAIWDDNGTILRQRGSVTCPEYHMKQVADRHSDRGFRFDSLIADESGGTLVDHILSVKSTNTPLDIREITWWREPHNAEWTDNRILNALNEQTPRPALGPTLQSREYRCYNEYLPLRERWPKPDLTAAVDSLTVFTVSVITPQQIRAALDLMDNALERAPAQELPVDYLDAGNFRPLKRYVGIDAEFSPVSLSDELLQQEINRRGPSNTARQTQISREESLCSVLTIAVDRHLVFSFYILHMLQHVEATTVHELSILFRRVLFNPQLLKLWFNYQADIPVLDATIAHMFQGTPRPDHMSKLPSEYGPPAELVHPTFKIHSQLFQSARPNDLQFPRGELGCELHRPGNSNTGLKCPCAETGNVDVTTVADFICRQLGYTRGLDWSQDVGTTDDSIDGFPIETMARPWTHSVLRYNYGKFIDGVKGTDRLHELLTFFKDVPRVVSRRLGIDIQARWYTLLRPGMEAEEDIMGYNIGDVVGIALLMRLLTTTDDRLSLAAKLINHDHVPDRNPYMTVPPKMPPGLSALQPPQNANLSLINDYPKLYQREPVGHLPVPDPQERPQQYGLNQRIGTLFRGRPNLWFRPEPYFKHEPRYHTRMMGRESPSALSLYGPLNPTVPPELQFPTGDQVAHEELFDPTDYTFPAWFTAAVNQPIKGADVVPGISHLDDLRERIVAESQRRGAGVLPPWGYNGSQWMQGLADVFGYYWAPQPGPPPVWPGGGGGASGGGGPSQRRVDEMAQQLGEFNWGG